MVRGTIHVVHLYSHCGRDKNVSCTGSSSLFVFMFTTVFLFYTVLTESKVVGVVVSPPSLHHEGPYWVCVVIDSNENFLIVKWFVLPFVFNSGPDL